MKDRTTLYGWLRVTLFWVMSKRYIKVK